MKKTQFLVLLALTGCLAVSGCSKDKNEDFSINVEAIESSPNTTETNSQPEIIVVEDTDTPPAPGMVRSRITNEWVTEEQNNTRPVAIMIPNSSTASHYGLSKASVLYECNVEGSMTRLMAIFDDWQHSEQLGNIRSVRDYYVFWAFEWDAIIIHYGGPFYIDDVIGRDDTQNINCINYEDVSFRNTAKNSTDNAFTSTDRIKKAMEHYGYPATYRSGYADEQHYKFAPFSTPNTLEQYSDSIQAERIDMSRCYPVTNCYFIYNKDISRYERYQNVSGGTNGPHIDEENNQQLTFKNILVQNTYHEVRDQKGYLAFQAHDTTRDGWFFTNGRGIHVTWEKLSDYGATRYYDDNGEEIELNTGQTMVLIVEEGDSFTVDDKVMVFKQ